MTAILLTTIGICLSAINRVNASLFATANNEVTALHITVSMLEMDGPRRSMALRSVALMPAVYLSHANSAST
jgi:hypothetical protein